MLSQEEIIEAMRSGFPDFYEVVDETLGNYYVLRTDELSRIAHAIAERLREGVLYSTDAKIHLRHDTVTVDDKQFPCGVAVLWKQSVGEMFVIANSFIQPELVKELQDGERVRVIVRREGDGR